MTGKKKNSSDYFYIIRHEYIPCIYKLGKTINRKSTYQKQGK